MNLPEIAFYCKQTFMAYVLRKEIKIRSSGSKCTAQMAKIKSSDRCYYLHYNIIDFVTLYIKSCKFSKYF